MSHGLGRTLLVFIALAAVAQSAELPQQHAYQKSLHSYLATLRLADFALEVKKFEVSKGQLSDAQKYRDWVSVFPYGWPYLKIIVAPADAFTLPAIESGDQVLTPASHAETAAWILSWKTSGNPYAGSTALKRRVFISSAIDLMMHDRLHEQGDGKANRSDFLGGTLIWLTYNYLKVRDVLPAEVQTAYEAGLKKLILRMTDWGPRGSMTDMDLFAPVSLSYALNVFPEDAQVQRIATAYSKPLFTDERFFHPAGYFVDGGCYDVSYNGISLYFAAWAATISDWPFARRAIEEAYRLRAHVSLPEPDGNVFSPTHMSSRTSADAPHDQWNWENRNVAAALVTDEALCAITQPTDGLINGGPSRRIGQLNGALARAQNAAHEEWTLQPWSERHWTGFGFLSTLIEPQAESFFARLEKLKSEQSDSLLLPMQRTENFIRNFGDALIVSKFDDFGVILHTGRVGEGHREWKRPYGFGGGALSAFWTPKTGSVILGRRRGIQGSNWDRWEEWRQWPSHAVSGITSKGGIFSSCRIRDPKPDIQIQTDRAEVKVAGTLPNENILQGKVLNGEIVYARRFALDKTGLTVETKVSSDGKDDITELYEVVPIFLREQRRQRSQPVTQIEFQQKSKWIAATAELVQDVTAVRAFRFGGAVEIPFDDPQRVKLSKAEWLDGYGSAATCQNVLIDLLPPTSHAKRHELKVRWHITTSKALRSSAE